MKNNKVFSYRFQCLLGSLSIKESESIIDNVRKIFLYAILIISNYLFKRKKGFYESTCSRSKWWRGKTLC